MKFIITENILCTQLDQKALREFFSILTPSANNYWKLSKLFESERFDFEPYNNTPETLEKLKHIKDNYPHLPMSHITRVSRLQKTSYGREWLLKNLDKLVNTDLSLDHLKPDLFTLEQNTTILTFALEHQRPFMRKASFCRIFQDLSIFDHEWLWLYLDMNCFFSLPDEGRRQQLLSILWEKAKKKDIGFIATIFLIAIKRPIDWEEVNIKQSELKNLLQDYEKARNSTGQDDDRLWKLYELLTPYFKDFLLKDHVAATAHTWLFFISCENKNESQIRKALNTFTNIYHPRDLNAYLLLTMCTYLAHINSGWDFKLKLPSAWSKAILESHTDYILNTLLPYESRLKQWRKTHTALLHNDPTRPEVGTGLIYLNWLIDGELAINILASWVYEHAFLGVFKLSPVLKFACELINNDGDSFIDTFWMGKVYQFAINGELLPRLDSTFIEAILTDDIGIKVYEQDFGSLANDVCVNPAGISFNTIKTIINATRKALNDFDLGFYYAPQDYTAIFQ